MHRSHQITGSSIIPVALTCILCTLFVKPKIVSFQTYRLLSFSSKSLESYANLVLEIFYLYLTIQGVRLSNIAGRVESPKFYETETSKLGGVEFQTLLLFKNHVFSFFCLRYHSSAIIKNMAYLGVPIIQDVCISYAMLVIKCFFLFSKTFGFWHGAA